MIELSYGDHADQDDLDRAILQTLGQKVGYVVQVTTEKGDEDVVIAAPSPEGDDLWVRAYDEENGDATGPTFVIDRADVHAIKIY